MKCEEARMVFWDHLDNCLSVENLRELEEHLSICSACSTEIDTLKEIKLSIKQSDKYDIETSTKRVLSNVYDRIKAEQDNRSVFGGFLSFKPVIGALATAAVLILSIIVLWPQNTSAVNLDNIMTKHVTCIKNGHFANYECHTLNAFSEKITNELGFAPILFNKGNHKFLKGDVCLINNNLAAHAIFKANGGVVSYFHVKSGAKHLLANKDIIEIGDGVWKYISQGHNMLLTETQKGIYAIYVSKLPFEYLLDLVKKDI